MRAIQLEMTDITADRHFAIDTTFVLFFLAVDMGQSVLNFNFGTILSFVTLIMLIALPYFLYERSIKPEFGSWAMGRTLIAFFAVILGIAYGQAIGSVLPESLRTVPFSLLIVAAMISIFMQFYDIIKVRLAK